MPTGKRSPFSRTHWPEPSMTGASERPPLLGTDVSILQGAERVSLAPHWTPRGISLHGACAPGYWPASLNATVRLGLVALSLTG